MPSGCVFGGWRTGSKILEFEAVREFFKGAVAAFRLRLAKFFANLYKQGVEFIEKLSISGQIGLKQLSKLLVIGSGL